MEESGACSALSELWSIGLKTRTTRVCYFVNGTKRPVVVVVVTVAACLV